MTPSSQVPRFLVDRSNLWLFATFLMGSCGLVAAVIVGQVRPAIMVVVLLILFALSRVDTRLAILGLFGFLTILGDLRRVLVPVVGWSGSDPILLVGPVVTVILMAGALMSRRIKTTSTLSKWMLVFTAIMMLQIFNPSQGGLAVGVAGAILVIVPTFWFWIGQAFGSSELLKVLMYKLVVPLSIVAMIMGFIQLAHGYLPYQIAWYKVAGYSSLGDSIDTLRPISIFPNITEYLIYVSIMIVLMTCALLHRGFGHRLKQAAVLLIPVGLIALFLAGSRGPVIMSLFVIVILWSIQGRSVASWMPRLGIAAVIGLMGLVWSLGQVSNVAGNERMQANLERQSALIEGGGTAGIHADLAWTGIRHGLIKEPLGMGIGAITLAASKFGGSGFNSEKDVTNMFIATGAAGGITYLIIVVMVAVTAIRFWIRTRSAIALALVAVLAVTGLSWLHPGHYVTTPLAWLLIGSLDGLSTKHELEQEVEDLQLTEA